MTIKIPAREILWQQPEPNQYRVYRYGRTSELISHLRHLGLIPPSLPKAAGHYQVTIDPATVVMLKLSHDIHVELLMKHTQHD